MEPIEILEQARTNGSAPYGWIILPLLRHKVITGIIGWIFGAIIGLGLFALMAPLMIPNNYQIGTGAAVFSTILLGIVLFIGLGSIWSLIQDMLRLRQASNHLIVITPEDFVKQEGTKIVHVPLSYVRHVTARGIPAPDRTPPKESMLDEVPRAGDNVSGFFFGRGIVPSGMRYRRKRMRTPTTLAFLDTRNNSEVIVVTDTSYGDPYMIAALLKKYATHVQQIA